MWYYSLVEPPDAFVFGVQREHPHDARCDTVRTGMTMLNKTCADDKPFPMGFTTVLMTLAHNCPAVFRYFAVRINVTDARQFPRHCKQRSIKVQGWDDLRREAWTQVRARWRDCANRRRELDANSKLEVYSRQDFGKYYRPSRRSSQVDGSKASRSRQNTGYSVGHGPEH